MARNKHSGSAYSISLYDKLHNWNLTVGSCFILRNILTRLFTPCGKPSVCTCAQSELQHTVDLFYGWAKEEMLLINYAKYSKHNLQCRIKGLCHEFHTTVKKKKLAWTQLAHRWNMHYHENILVCWICSQGHTHGFNVCVCHSDSFIWDWRSVVCCYWAQRTSKGNHGQFALIEAINNTGMLNVLLCHP